MVHSGENILQGNSSESKCMCQRTVCEAVAEVEIKQEEAEDPGTPGSRQSSSITCLSFPYYSFQSTS